MGGGGGRGTPRRELPEFDGRGLEAAGRAPRRQPFRWGHALRRQRGRGTRACANTIAKPRPEGAPPPARARARARPAPVVPRGQQVYVWVRRQDPEPVVLPPERLHARALGHVPHPDGLVLAVGDDQVLFGGVGVLVALATGRLLNEEVGWEVGRLGGWEVGRLVCKVGWSVGCLFRGDGAPHQRRAVWGVEVWAVPSDGAARQRAPPPKPGARGT